MKELTVFEKFDMLPRRLDVIGNGNRNGRYRIVIIDNETSGSANCCIIRYAKEWKDGFSNDNLFEVQGKSLEEAIFNMYEKYLVLKPQYIRGIEFLDKEYQFDKTHRIEEINGETYCIPTN